MGARQSAIQRHSALCNDERPSGDNPFVKGLVKACALLGQNPLADFHARISQLRDAPTGVARIDIYCADNYLLHASLEDRIGAGGSPPDRGTGFQSNV